MNDWHRPEERTAADLAWSASWRKYGPTVERLLADPAALRLTFPAGGSVSLTAETPGPAEVDELVESGL